MSEERDYCCKILPADMRYYRSHMMTADRCMSSPVQTTGNWTEHMAAAAEAVVRLPDMSVGLLMGMAVAADCMKLVAAMPDPLLHMLVTAGHTIAAVVAEADRMTAAADQRVDCIPAQSHGPVAHKPVRVVGVAVVGADTPVVVVAADCIDLMEQRIRNQIPDF
jgi:hypothetical protein